MSVTDKIRDKITTSTIVVGTVGVAAMAVAPYAVVPIVQYFGFQSGGILAGSWASGIMASYGGAVGAGSVCAALQSVGATGAISSVSAGLVSTSAGIVSTKVASKVLGGSDIEQNDGGGDSGAADSPVKEKETLS